MVSNCDSALYAKLIQTLMSELKSSRHEAQTLNSRTYIQALGSICRQAGHRFGEHVKDVVPTVLELARADDDETREHCLQVKDTHKESLKW